MGLVDKSGHYNLNSYTINDLKQYAQSKGGDCLSKVYTNIDKRYKWTCANGHTWFASFHSVYHHNTWCPECAHRGGGSKGGIYRAKLKTILKKLKWEMVSEYGCDHSRTMFRCQYGHKFKAKPSEISYDSKCPVCNKKQMLVSKVIETINLKKGELLTDTNDIVKIRDTVISCKCDEGHIFQISLNNLLNCNTWCPECAHKKRRTKMILHHKLKKANSQ